MKTKNNQHPELSNKAGSIANTLRNISKEVNDLVNSSSASATNLKLFISEAVNVINEKVVKSPATVRFLEALNKQASKQGILSLVWNTILAGDNVGAI